MSEFTISARVRTVTYEAPDILSYWMEREDGQPLPPAAPGSHVELVLPNGMTRSYSLSAHSKVGGAYRLTIARESEGRGGSVWIHDNLRPGAILRMGAARENFHLNEAAGRSVFIAGGIGITPFVAMAVQLNSLGKAWELHYCARSSRSASLLPELRLLANKGHGRLIERFKEEPDYERLNIRDLLASLGTESHAYCCGPNRMLDDFRAAARELNISSDQIHFEYFASDVEVAAEGGFSIELAQSGVTIEVKPGQTILHAVLEAGVDIPYTCEEGVCGACETRIISGEADHRDMILSDDERAAQKTMMICCSGSKSACLTLDL